MAEHYEADDALLLPATSMGSPEYSNCRPRQEVGRGQGSKYQIIFQLLLIVLLTSILITLGYIGIQLKTLADVVQVVDDDVKLTGAVTSVLSAIVTSFATTLQTQIANVPSLAEDLMQYDYAPPAKAFQDTLTSLRDDYSQVHADFCNKHNHHNDPNGYAYDDADDAADAGTCRLQPIDRANFFIGLMDTVKASFTGAGTTDKLNAPVLQYAFGLYATFGNLFNKTTWHTLGPLCEAFAKRVQTMSNPQWEETCFGTSPSNGENRDCDCTSYSRTWFGGFFEISGRQVGSPHDCSFDTSKFPESVSCITCRVDI